MRLLTAILLSLFFNSAWSQVVCSGTPNIEFEDHLIIHLQDDVNEALNLSTSTNTDLSNSSFYNQCFEHFSEIEGELVKSEPPPLLLNELALIYQSELGKKLESACLALEKPFKFVLVDPNEAYAADAENHIFYTPDVNSWYSGKSDIPEGAHLEVATLGSLIVHEMGHTPIGRTALSLPIIDPHVKTESENSEMVVSFSLAKIKQEEIRAVRLFENVYRRFIGIPQRESYYEQGDITH